MATVTGTNNNDILIFSGVTQQLSLTIVNSYSGKSITIDEEKNVNDSSYEGFAGIDTLLMSNIGDVLFVTDSVGVQLIFNVEQIFAGQGGDVIALDHATVTLGDMLIDGGASDDILWANVGNDTVRGLGGNDILDGGPGNDLLQGGSENDTVAGGAGADWIQGNQGDDVLEAFVDDVWASGASTVNAVTGEEADLAGRNRFHDTYDGGTEYDRIVLTGGNDALVLDDPVSPRHPSTSGARVTGVERIDAGAGDDVVNMTSGTMAYGAVAVYGGDGHDILWTGAGDDTLDGGDGDDRLHGGAGGDTLHGGAGADHLDGGDGDDVLVFSGNGDVYNGGAGADTLQLTAAGDAFVYDGANLAGVETVLGGAGNDTIDLSAGVYGAVTVDAQGGDDTVKGNGGDDTLRGGDGADTLLGNLGDDRLEGGAGDDILYGGDESILTVLTHDFSGAVAFPTLQELEGITAAEAAAQGIAAGDLSVSYATTADITFVQSVAGFKNSLGFYSIAADGTIQGVEMAFAHVKTTMQGQTYSVALPGAPDTDFGFFIISDGYTHNDGYAGLDFSGGILDFIYGYGTAGERAATVNDAAADISLVYSDGVADVVLSGPVYHSTARGGSTALNADGKHHVVSGLADPGDDGTLRIGFEDLPCLGDEDYNDVVFDITVGSAVTGATQPGDDILIGGAGSDTLYGGGGADAFVFTNLGDGVDTVADFSAGEGDTLNITDILDGFDPLADAIGDFVRMTQQGADTVLEIDADGAGGDFAAAAIIAGGLGGATLADLVASGTLVADQSLAA